MKGESAEDFFLRYFPELNEMNVFSVIEGKWGDPDAGTKLMAFYRPEKEDYWGCLSIVLQESKKNEYQRLDLEHIFGIGAYPWTSTIEGHFFLDYDSSGTQDLVIYESGIIRCEVELEEYNEETKQMDTIYTTASCDLCGWTIFEQMPGSTTVEVLESNEHDTGDCTEADIRRYIIESEK